MVTAETLSRQGLMRALDLYREAVKEIDKMMGEGYAKEHPELIGQILMAANIDYAGSIIADRLSDALTYIGDCIERNSDSTDCEEDF